MKSFVLSGCTCHSNESNTPFWSLPNLSRSQPGKLLLGKRNLIVVSPTLLFPKLFLMLCQDEVDDTRKTLQWVLPIVQYICLWFRLSYALSELKKDVELELLSYPESEREALRSATSFAIFVVHNKLKDKLAELPAGTPYATSFALFTHNLIFYRDSYFSGEDVGDVWQVLIPHFDEIRTYMLLGWTTPGKQCELYSTACVRYPF